MATAKSPMSTEQLHEHQSYRALNDRQKFWVDSFIASNGDRVFATNAAYDFKDRETARSNGYHILHNPKIQVCLGVFYGRAPFELFQELVLRATGKRRFSRSQLVILRKLETFFNQTRRKRT